jgi:hypothetical protein
MLISKAYVEKAWTVHERRSAQERVLAERDNEYLLPVRIDGSPVPGLPPIRLDVSLPPLSAAYFVFRFHVSVRSFELRHNLQSFQAAGAEVVVFTRQGQDWTLQPRWGGEDVHSFCRDRGAERIDEMLVILGNAAATPARDAGERLDECEGRKLPESTVCR